jgi:hypothetical protein
MEPLDDVSMFYRATHGKRVRRRYWRWELKNISPRFQSAMFRQLTHETQNQMEAELLYDLKKQKTVGRGTGAQKREQTKVQAGASHAHPQTTRRQQASAFQARQLETLILTWVDRGRQLATNEAS